MAAGRPVDAHPFSLFPVAFVEFRPVRYQRCKKAARCIDRANTRSTPGFPPGRPAVILPAMVGEGGDQRGGWETFPHGSDIGVSGSGPTLAAAFENAAIALTSVTTDPACVRSTQEVRVTLKGTDPEMLFYDWIDALVFEASTRHMLFGRFEVAMIDEGLEARLFGERVDVPRHEPAVEVKGPTLTGLSVARDPAGGWVARCVVDV